MKVKTSELTGQALDWAVAKAICPPSFADNINPASGLSFWSEGWLSNGGPSTDWGRCGPLIAEYIEHMSIQPGDTWMAVAFGHFTYYKGPTPQIAICRAVVAYKLGDEIELPSELFRQEPEKP
ncbi:TPA: phage protein NinX family protein [Serratia fonticola]